MIVRKIFPDELSWVNMRYAEVSFRASPDSDLIAIAEIDGVRAGLGRITFLENGTGELGGMYVLPEFRGNAVAGNIIDFLLKESACSTLYCIPFAHLNGFYRRFGFVPADPDSPVPHQVSDKFIWCQSTYDAPVLLMVRHSSDRNQVR